MTPGDGGFVWLQEMEALGDMALGDGYFEARKSESSLWEEWVYEHGLAEPMGHRGSLTTTPTVASCEGG